jgi:hypothetical protein
MQISHMHFAAVYYTASGRKDSNARTERVSRELQEWTYPCHGIPGCGKGMAFAAASATGLLELTFRYVRCVHEGCQTGRCAKQRE